jgi:hypothetical protein
MRNSLTLAVAFALGVAVWLGLSVLSPDVSPLDSGVRLLLASGIAGFLIALVEGEITWDSLLALYVGQITSLTGLAFFTTTPPDAPPLPLQLLFLVCFNLAAAAGGAIGALGNALVRQGTLEARDLDS